MNFEICLKFFFLTVVLSFRRKEKSSRETPQSKVISNDFFLIFVELLAKISPYVEMTKIGDSLCRISSVISPLGRNDKD